MWRLVGLFDQVVGDLAVDGSPAAVDDLASSARDLLVAASVVDESHVVSFVICCMQLVNTITI